MKATARSAAWGLCLGSALALILRSWGENLPPWSEGLDRALLWSPDRWTLLELWCGTGGVPGLFDEILSALLVCLLAAPAFGLLVTPCPQSSRGVSSGWFRAGVGGALIALLATPEEGRSGSAILAICFLPWLLGVAPSGWVWTGAGILLGVVSMAVHPAVLWLPLVLLATAAGACLDGDRRRARHASAAAVLLALTCLLPQFRDSMLSAIAVLRHASSLTRGFYGVYRPDLADQRVIALLCTGALCVLLYRPSSWSERFALLTAWALLFIVPRSGVIAGVLTGALTARLLAGRLHASESRAGVESCGVLLGAIAMCFALPPLLPPAPIAAHPQRALIALVAGSSEGIPLFHDPESAPMLERSGFDPWVTSRAECLAEPREERDQRYSAYAQIRLLQSGWRERLATLAPRAVFLRERSPLLGVLEAIGWTELSRTEPLPIRDRGRELNSPYIVLAPPKAATLAASTPPS